MEDKDIERIGELLMNSISPTTGLNLDQELELDEKEIVIDVSYFDEDDGGGGNGTGDISELTDRLKKMIEEAKRIKQAELEDQAKGNFSNGESAGCDEPGERSESEILRDVNSDRINVDRKQRF